MTLYKINDQIKAIVESDSSTDPETGVLTEEAERALDALNLAKDEKLESYALYIKNLTAEANAIAAEIQALTQRKHSIEKTADRLRGYLSDELSGAPFKTPRVVVSWRTAKSVQLDDGFMDWAKKDGVALLRYKDPEPDKALISKYLKEGHDVPHAALVEKKSMTIK